MAGILASKAPDTFTTYLGAIVIRDRIMGGTPKNPKMIEGWLRTKAGIDQKDELVHMMLRTLRELDPTFDPTPFTKRDMDSAATLEALIDASSKIASEVNTNGFKRDENGLYIESRYIKSMLREAVAINFPASGDVTKENKWGPTKKAAQGYFRERVFVDPFKLHLGVDEPTGILQWVGHVITAGKPQSIVAYVEYVERAEISFEVQVLKGSEIDLTEDKWARLWSYAESNGIGAYRSQGFGTFDLVRWEKKAR